ncbi:putative alpha-L-rhamnosidase, partial [Paenibacillus sp. 598K]
MAKDEGFAELAWDTGRVESDRSVLIAYDGEPLQARTRYYYRVQVWDGADEPSSWSEPSWWETALRREEWQAAWITAARQGAEEVESADYLRRDFTLEGEVASARLYATALGLYHLYVNGRRPDDSQLAPGWTSYTKRLQYQTYDVTEL